MVYRHIWMRTNLLQAWVVWRLHTQNQALLVSSSACLDDVQVGSAGTSDVDRHRSHESGPGKILNLLGHGCGEDDGLALQGMQDGGRQIRKSSSSLSLFLSSCLRFEVGEYGLDVFVKAHVQHPALTH